MPSHQSSGGAKQLLEFVIYNDNKYSMLYTSQIREKIEP